MQARSLLLSVFLLRGQQQQQRFTSVAAEPCSDSRLRLRWKEKIMTTVISLGSMLDEEWKIELEAARILDRAAVDIAGRSNCTLIQTAHSTYLFLENTPAEPSGLLVGGAVGECPTTAYLIGSMSSATGEAEYPTCLRAGERAIFQVVIEGVCKRVITSPVVNVVHGQVRAGESHATSNKPLTPEFIC
jgi:hypothetical protein